MNSRTISYRYAGICQRLPTTACGTGASALDLPHHMAPQVKPQATTVPAVFDFVFHMSGSNRFFAPYA